MSSIQSTPFISSIPSRLMEHPPTSSFGSLAHGQDLDERVNQLESTIEAYSLNIPAAERAECLRTWRRMILALRATIATMKAAGSNAHAIHIEINELVHKFNTARHNFAEGNARFEVDKTRVVQERDSKKEKIKQLQSQAPKFGKFVHPAPSEDYALPDMEKIKIQFARCIQAIDPESPFSDMQCVIHHSAKLPKEKQDELVKSIPSARAGQAVNSMAIIPAAVSEVFSQIMEKAVIPTVKTFVKAAASEQYLTENSQLMRPPQDYEAHMQNIGDTLDGKNQEVNQVLQQTITPSMRSAAAALARVDAQFKRLDESAQDNFRTVPHIVHRGLTGFGEIAVSSVASAVAGPVIKGTVATMRGTVRGVEVTAQGIKTGAAATARTIRTAAKKSKTEAVLAAKKAAFTKAGFNLEKISMLQSVFESRYLSEFSFNRHTPEALRFYEFREGLHSLKINANLTSKTNRLIASFLGDESGSVQLPKFLKKTAEFFERKSKPVPQLKIKASKTQRPDPSYFENRIDYSIEYKESAANFIKAKEFEGVLKKDLYIAQYHCGEELHVKRSLKWFMPVSEANKNDTLEQIMQACALLPNWGERSHVTIAKIPAGEHVQFLHGRAAPQICGDGPVTHVAKGGGVQYRFMHFDPKWILETRKIP